jgi:ATP adenylyltransferase
MKNRHSFQTSRAIENYSASRSLWDTPIFESRSFMALPTVGALVEGWLLVVPKTPTLSFSRLSMDQFSELEVFLDEIMPTIEACYGSVSVFEHGPAVTGSSVGCGVDYAHLHLVPAKCDLLKGAQQIAPNITWSQIKCFNEIRQCAMHTDGYWFLKQNYKSDICYLGKCQEGEPISQLFRRVIAGSLGNASAYDWKTSLGEANITATIEKLTQSVHLA